MEIKLLQPDEEQEYEAFLKSDEHTLIYSSIKYRNLLRRIVNGEDYYLVAKENGQIVGALPIFMKHNNVYGNIINSLPFYGSNGGAICSSSVPGCRDIKRKLLDAFYNLAEEKAAVSTTIITNPFEEHIDIYEKFTYYDYRDSRIGQLTPLPNIIDGIDSAVMEILHSKTRNMIRKAYKAKIQWGHSGDIDDLRFLAATHKINMEAIGGLAKELSFFQQVRDIFSYDTDYRIYIAELNGQRIAALLIFYYNKTVEYFTPAIVEYFRDMQPSSLLIFEAMKDAMLRGYRYWNWGGTWLAQESVYHFKKHWGTKDLPYFYYVRLFDKRILQMTKETMLREYQYFYTVPFGVLRS